MRRLVVAMAVIGCTLIAPAVVYASWGAPVQVASSRLWKYGAPEVARDTQGDGVVVWEREEWPNERQHGVETSTRDGGADWSGPVKLNSSSTSALFPQVEMNAQGDAVATWEGGSKGFRGIEVTRGGQMGGWERPVRVPGSDEDKRPALAVDKRGDASIVYTGRVAAGGGVMLSVQRRGQGWRARRVFAETEFYPRDPQVAVDSRGETIVAWVAASANNNWVQAIILDSKGQPEGPAQILSSRRGHSTELRLVINEKGDAVLVWRQAGVKRRPVEVATRSSGARFTGAVTVSRGDDIEPTAAIKPNGDATILFTRILGRQLENPGGKPPPGVAPATAQTSAVEVVSRRGHDRWTHPAPIAPAAGSSTFAPQIASAPAGNEMMVVWTNAPFRSTEFNAYPGKIEASVSTGTSSWQAPVAISAGESRSPSIAVSSDGDATAAWITSHKPEKTESLEVAEYKTAP